MEQEKEKKKYAGICINCRLDEEDMPLIRRVLIGYGSFEDGIFKDTWFVECDPYFKDSSKSHQYKFEDDGYSLISLSNAKTYEAAALLGSKRLYHYYSENEKRFASIFGIPAKKLAPIFYEAESDAKAKQRFNMRKELR